MSDRFDALMSELSEELSSLPQSDGDEMIRASNVERGDRLEVLCDRMATRGAELTLRVYELNATLSMLEQESLIQGRRVGIWSCPRCGAESTMRAGIHHTGDCPFSLISDDEVYAKEPRS